MTFSMSGIGTPSEASVPKGGMMFDHKIETIEDYVQAFMNREGTPVAIDGGRAIKVCKIDKLVNPEHEATFEICTHKE